MNFGHVKSQYSIYDIPIEKQNKTCALNIRNGL